MYDFSKLKNNRSSFLLTTPIDLAKYDLKIEFLTQTFSGKDFLWEDLADFSKSSTITLNYRRLLALAKAYHCKTSKYCGNKLVLDCISQGFEFLHNKVYNQSIEQYYDNWWDWEIGTPITMLNILCLVDLKNSDKYLHDIKHFCPDSSHSMQRAKRDTIISLGANRVDCVKRDVMMGVCLEDADIIQNSLSCLAEVYKILPLDNKSDIKDGFYSDFSFIQHDNIPYTGTYGNVLLSGLAEISIILGENIFNNNDIYEIIENSFMPIIYNGYSFDMLNGRGATRENFQSLGFGVGITSSIALFSEFAPIKYAEKFKSFVKYQLLAINLEKTRQHVVSDYVYSKLVEIYNDEQISPQKLCNKAYAYNKMERMICVRDDFTVGFALNSKRIKPYEYMHGENKQGYHSSDGAYYIYDSNNEFSDNYIATINPNRIPGTTIFDEKYPDCAMESLQNNSIANVLSVNNFYGIACMEIDKENGMQAKKSYFVLEDKIVALGSNISQNAKTIVDTKKYTSTPLKFEGFYYLNDTAYFTENDIICEDYVQNRSFYDVNSNASATNITQRYNSLVINHNISDEYSYIIAPKIPLQSAHEFAQNNDVKILTMDENCHAISYKNMIYINFWKSAEFDFCKTSAPVSICIVENFDDFSVTISDISKEFDEIVVKIHDDTITLNKFETKNIQIRK
ncbi:MAG: polysaccharide lyase family 8 super-sandwich domain-containing protein [Clostridia bacterium]